MTLIPRQKLTFKDFSPAEIAASEQYASIFAHEEAIAQREANASLPPYGDQPITMPKRSPRSRRRSVKTQVPAPILSLPLPE